MNGPDDFTESDLRDEIAGLRQRLSEVEAENKRLMKYDMETQPMMSEPGTHTPGDWVFSTFCKPDGAPIVTVEDVAETIAGTARHSERTELFGVSLDDADKHKDGRSTVICYTGNGPNAHNNAALIAMAPRLLDENGALRAQVAALKEIIGTYDGNGVAADCSLAIATLQSETGGEANYSRADREIHNALARGVDAGRQVTQLLADQERMREALKGCANMRLFVEVYDGRAFDKARIIAVLDAVDAALSTPRQP